LTASRAASHSVNITALQTDIQKKQHEIGRLQFLATHRPKLHIRHVAIDDGTHIGHPTIFFKDGAEVRGGLSVVNVGGSSAIIISSRYRIYCTTTGLPASKAPYEERSHNLLCPSQVLKIGESCAAPISDTLEMFTNASDGPDLRAFDKEGWRLFVMGDIRYQDEGGADRFMGFCRERGSDGRFHVIEDPDYEYQD
jgi:hypothetical protein